MAIPTPAAAQHESHGVPVLLDTGGSHRGRPALDPGMELDADGRISMRGSTSVLVLMNGRRTPLTGDALVAALRQVPASGLERIKAGTAASARQEAMAWPVW